MVENLPDDVLLEILTRVGDCESIIRCSSVSKRWFSLITGNSKLNHRFNHRCRPQVRTQLIGFRREKNGALHHCYYELGSGKKRASKSRLDFLPWEREEVIIRAAAGDLLLVESEEKRELCVVNPLTKQAVVLPRCPTNEATRWGLAFESNRCDTRVRCNCDIRYKAVLIEDHCLGVLMRAITFSSETGEWAHTEFRGPLSSHCRVFTFNNNALLWLIQNSHIAKYCPFKHPRLRLSYIPMPDQYECTKTEQLLLGSSRGRLCLAQTVWDFGVDRHFIKVWEHRSFGNGSEDWVLLHDVQFQVRHRASVSVCGFHPSDGDKLFVLRDGFIYEYHIAESVFQRLSGLSKTKLNRPISDYYTLFHYSKPTFIPPLPTPLSPSSPLFSTFKLLAACLPKLCSKALCLFKYH